MRLIVRLIVRLIELLNERMIEKLIEMGLKLIEMGLKLFFSSLFDEISLESKLYLQYQILYLVFFSSEVVLNQIVKP